MSSMRLLLASAIAAAILTAGCAGAKPAATADATAPAPADASVYVSIDSDRDSAQWQQLDALLQRVPGAKEAVDGLLADALDGAGLNWNEDIAPALGPEVAVVVAGGSSDPVALTQPDDRAKLEALLGKSGKTLVSRELDGWTAVAESEAALDAYQAALKKGELSEQPDFQAALAGLPEAALVRFYGSNTGLAALGMSLAGTSGGSVAGLAPGTFGLAVVAEHDGVRLVGNATQENLPASFAPTLLGRVPADALAVATFEGGDQLTGQVRKALSGGGALLKTFEQQLGVSLDDVVSLLGGEGVLYVRPGSPLPELTLVLTQTDPKQPATLASLFRSLAAAAKGQLATDTEDGVEVTRLGVGPLSVGYASTGGLLLVTTGRGGIAAFRSGGAKLVDTPAFHKAAQQVGYDGSTSGFVYADVDGLAPLLQGLAALSGGAPAGLKDVLEALGSLDSLTLDVSTSGDRATLSGFLAVR